MVRYISFDLASSALETFSAKSSSNIRSFDCNFQLDALLAPSYFNQRRWGSLQNCCPHACVDVLKVVSHVTFRQCMLLQA